VAHSHLLKGRSRPARGSEEATKVFQDCDQENQVSASIFPFSLTPTDCRELSNGHLSDDNHKRLNGQDTEIPIYEAKMTRDTRLIVGVILRYL
jgi:hypothetical protein